VSFNGALSTGLRLNGQIDFDAAQVRLAPDLWHFITLPGVTKLNWV
jgi:hypothetical protein